MSAVYLLSSFLVLVLAAYLAVALLRPERFE